LCRQNPGLLKRNIDMRNRKRRKRYAEKEQKTFLGKYAVDLLC
jgi:hypothetical protein